MKILLALLAMAVCSLAADVTGKWALTAPTAQGGEMKVRLFIHADGDTYSGTVSSDQGDAPVSDIKVKGSELSFKIETDDAVYEIAATVDGDKMKGSFTLNKNPGGNFTGTREK